MKPSWSNESALAWLQRSRGHLASTLANLDGSPRSAANAFLCKTHVDGEQQKQQDGTGIVFIDEVFRYHHSHVHRSSSSNNNISNDNMVVFEIAGRHETGKTTTLLALAASYLVKTSPDKQQQAFPTIEPSNSLWNPHENARDSWSPEDKVEPPSIIILDSDYGVHIPHLVSTIRAAVLHKWQTQEHPCSQPDQQHLFATTANLSNNAMNTNPFDIHGKEEYLMAYRLEDEVAHLLSRIHLVRIQTKDDFSIVFELLRHALDQARQVQHNQQYARSPGDERLSNKESYSATTAYSTRVSSSSLLKPSMLAAPPMLIIDSINAFEQRDRILSDGGVSSTNDFLRQLNRLIRSYPELIVFASRMVFSSGSSTSTNDLWKRMVTHSVALERVLPSPRLKNEFDFVAVSSKPRLTVPFSMSTGRIIC